MNRLKRNMIIGVVFVLITGVLSHFLYEWTGNSFLAGLFTPVNESVWEHMKLLFFPMLFYSLILIIASKESYDCLASSLCFGILTGTLLIPVLFYAYTSLLGKNVLALDIATFALSVIWAFWERLPPDSVLQIKAICRITVHSGVSFLSLLFTVYLQTTGSENLYFLHRRIPNLNIITL